MSKVDRPLTVVAARRAVRIAAGIRPDFVGGSMDRSGPRLWMESLEQRRVLSANLSHVAVLANPPLPAVANLVMSLNGDADDTRSSDDSTDDSTDTGTDDGSDTSTDDGSCDGGSADDGSVDDGSTDDSATDDGSDADAPAVPTNLRFNSPTLIDVVDSHGNVIQSYELDDVWFTQDGTASGESGSTTEYDQYSLAEWQATLPAGTASGQAVTFTWDDEGNPVAVAAVPDTAIDGSDYQVATPVPSDGAQIVALRADWYANPYADDYVDYSAVTSGDSGDDGTDGAVDPNDAINNGGPTTSTVKGTSEFDVIDADGKVLQSYKLDNTTFGEGDIASTGYYQVSIDDLTFEIPGELAQGQSVTFTWDNETGTPKIVTEIPTTADPYTTYSTATRVSTDDPDVVTARTEWQSEWVDYDNSFDGQPIAWERGDGHIYYSMGGLGAEPTDLSSTTGIEVVAESSVVTEAVTAIPTDATAPNASGSFAVPLPPVAAFDSRPSTNDILTSHKDDNIMGTQSADLLSVIK